MSPREQDGNHRVWHHYKNFHNSAKNNQDLIRIMYVFLKNQNTIIFWKHEVPVRNTEELRIVDYHKEGTYRNIKLADAKKNKREY